MQTWTRFIVAGFVLVSARFVMAQPGSGINIAGVNVSPYVSLEALYDDNVFLDKEDEQSDMSLRLGYGFNFSRSTDTLTLAGRVWGLSERYDDFTEQDHDDFGNELNILLESEGGFTLALDQSFADVEDIDYQSTDIQDYRLHRLGATLGAPLTEKMDADAGYRYTLKDFTGDSLFDWDRHIGSANLYHEVTDTSAVMLRGELGVLDSDGNDDTGNYYNTLIGLESRRTDKIIARGGIGVLGLDSDDTDVSDLSWLLEATWRASDLISLTVLSDRVIEPASIARNNYHVISTVESELRYNPVEQITLALRLSYRYYDLQNDFSVGDDLVQKQEDIYLGAIRMTYNAPGGYLQWHVEAETMEQESTIVALDYTRSAFSTGVTLRY